MQKIEIKNNEIPLDVIDDMSISHELGKDFTWINPDNANQRGWGLNQEKRTQFAEGKIRWFVLALDDEKLRTLGGLGGIDIILNSKDNGFCIDYKSFPWYWDRKTRIGGYTSYSDLLAGIFTYLDSGRLYLIYDITTHPDYDGFIKDMVSGFWGQISIQYGIGINDLPLIDAYLIG